MAKNTVKILGQDYEVQVKPYSSDSAFTKGRAAGYCNHVEKKVIACDMLTFPGYEDSKESYLHDYMEEIIRHEIVHAFLFESGLGFNSAEFADSWAVNEEMVDWISLQLVKMNIACEEAIEIVHRLRKKGKD